MKRIIGLFLLCFLLLPCQKVNARSRTLDPWSVHGKDFLSKPNYYTINCHEEDCDGVNTLYLKIKVPKKGLLYFGAVEAYEKGHHLPSEMIPLSYSLCDKNKKVIDPYDGHTFLSLFGVPHSPFFTVKAGTYYLKIDLGKHHLETIVCSAHLTPKSSVGGTSRKKAYTLKQKKKRRLLFPLGENKKSCLWFKFYTNGKKPVKIKFDIEEVCGAFEMTYYGPSYPKGITHVLPDNKSWGEGGFTVKGDKIYSTTGTTDTLARSNGVKTIGPKKGWYYIKISKVKVKGKAKQAYQKRSLCMTIKYKG